MILDVWVYRGPYDCTNGGITSKKDTVNICFNDEDIFELPTKEEMNKCDLLVKADYICGERPTIRAFWLENGERKSGLMSGGNFVYSPDSRFPKITAFGMPISVHDRIEQ